MFNLFLCGLFLFKNGIDNASYADDNTPYTVDKNPEKIIKALKNIFIDFLTRLKNNGMKVLINADKCYLLANSKEKVHVKIGPYDIHNKEQQKLLGILISIQLNFDKHINNLCAKTSQKLFRKPSLMIINKKWLLYVFVMSCTRFRLNPHSIVAS